MSTITVTRNDLQLRDHVTQQLDWEPAVDAGGIGVSARDGIVTLTGFVGTYAEKLAAERAAKRVRYVRGVANDLDVRVRLGRTDPEIARDAVRALQLRGTVPDTVQASVHDGHVTLTGRVRSLFQAHEAEKAVQHVKGLRGVFSHMDVSPDGVAGDVRHHIVEALHRDADLDAHHVSVDIVDGAATLYGTVTSWQQRDTAERAAAHTAGISRVLNRIIVRPRDPDEMA